MLEFTKKVIKRHKDRFSCEISATMNLGGDDWPIYIEPDPSKGGDTDNGYKSEMTKGVEVNLKPGDMLVYRGNICEHWREPFVGQDCGQVFLHYNNAATKGSKDNIFDGRPHLGLPHNFKRIKWRLMYKAMAKKSVVKTLTKRVFNHD